MFTARQNFTQRSRELSRPHGSAWGGEPQAKKMPEQNIRRGMEKTALNGD